MKSRGGVTVPVVTTGGDERRLCISLTDQPSIPSISIASGLKPNFKFEQYSPLNTMASSSVESFDEPRMQVQSTLQAWIMPAVPPASVPPQFHDTTKPIMRAYSGVDAV
jgi:hypothetical protein